MHTYVLATGRKLAAVRVHPVCGPGASCNMWRLRVFGREQMRSRVLFSCWDQATQADRQRQTETDRQSDRRLHAARDGGRDTRSEEKAETAEEHRAEAAASVLVAM